MTDIFDSTLKLKDFIHDNNPQLVKINDKIELSGFSPYIMAHYHNLEKDYDKITKEVNSNFMFDTDVFFTQRILKDGGGFIKSKELSVNKINTKEYWNFIHTHFPFCDVSSYYSCNNLTTYYNIKGKSYDKIIEKIGIVSFKDKKILEVGPGYGYLPRIFFKENNIKCSYYCADIVKRFDHDNFIEVSGYSLDNITDKFDIVIMQDVIQHLGTEIFKNYVSHINKHLLNENGMLIIGTELRQKNDYTSFFFGQCYDGMGFINTNEYLSNELGFDTGYIPYSLNNKYNNGTVIVCKK